MSIYILLHLTLAYCVTMWDNTHIDCYGGAKNEWFPWFSFVSCLPYFNNEISGEYLMKRHARKAYDELKKMGVKCGQWDWSSEHFNISGEDQHGDWSMEGIEAGKAYIVDYYAEYGTEISSEIEDVLEKNGLYCEWHNPGVLCVYDA